MKKETRKNYYNNEDLINFEKLNKFKDFKSNKLDDNQAIKHPVKYSVSDNNFFKKIINIKNAEESLKNVTHKLKENTYYNSSDFQKFDKLKQFTNFTIDKDSKPKNEYLEIPTSYTTDDISKFNKIIKNENKNISDLKVNNKKIKVIDFDKLNSERKKTKNKIGIEKIKIVYFD
tara:strand:+ start:282 stop:803 length:522 start_codon:yes stop_codon:yes gene_type:complete